MKRSILLFLIPFIIFTYASFIVFQKGCEYGMSAHAEKNMHFSHKRHIEEYGASDCEICHFYKDNGRYSGIPTIETCFQCHGKEEPLFRKLDDNDKPWESFAKQPDHVYFSHIVHMKSTFPDGRQKNLCVNCHGNKEEDMKGVKIMGMMKMDRCEDCHDHLYASNKCFVCHD